MSVYETARNVGLVAALTIGSMTLDSSPQSVTAQEQTQPSSRCRLATPEDDPEKIFTLMEWRVDYADGVDESGYWKNGLLIFPVEGVYTLFGAAVQGWYPQSGIRILSEDTNIALISVEKKDNILAYWGSTPQIIPGDWTVDVERGYEQSCDLDKVLELGGMTPDDPYSFTEIHFVLE